MSIFSDCTEDIERINAHCKEERGKELYTLICESRQKDSYKVYQAKLKEAIDQESLSAICEWAYFEIQKLEDKYRYFDRSIENLVNGYRLIQKELAKGIIANKILCYTLFVRIEMQLMIEKIIDFKLDWVVSSVNAILTDTHPTAIIIILCYLHSIRKFVPEEIRGYCHNAVNSVYSLMMEESSIGNLFAKEAFLEYVKNNNIYMDLRSEAKVLARAGFYRWKEILGTGHMTTDLEIHNVYQWARGAHKSGSFHPNILTNLRMIYFNLDSERYNRKLGARFLMLEMVSYCITGIQDNLVQNTDISAIHKTPFADRMKSLWAYNFRKTLISNSEIEIEDPYYGSNYVPYNAIRNVNLALLELYYYGRKISKDGRIYKLQSNHKFSNLCLCLINLSKAINKRVKKIILTMIGLHKFRKTAISYISSDVLKLLAKDVYTFTRFSILEWFNINDDVIEDLITALRDFCEPTFTII